MFPYKDLVKTRRFPFVTLLLIAANIALFVFELMLAPEERNRLIYQYATLPLEFRIGHNLPISLGPPPFLTLFSSLFLHGGLLHLVGNMLYLWIFGDNVEDRLGSIRFFFFYLLCGLLANLAHIYTNFDSKIPSLGASGAIAGILSAYLWLYPRAQVAVLVPVFYFLRRVILPAWLVIGGWILIQVIEVHLSPIQVEGGIAYYAHIGGFVAGLVLLPAFKVRKR